MNLNNVLPGWTIKIDETYNGVFKLTLNNRHGNKAEVTGLFDESLEKVKEFAFDIEKQISQNWSRFLYDLFLLKLDKQNEIETEYNDNAFGSWYIHRGDRMLVYDGKNSSLVSRKQSNDIWIDLQVIFKDKLTYKNSIDIFEESLEK